MAADEIISAIDNYLAVLPKMGVHPTLAVLFGSHVNGTPHTWSDIDVLVVAPEFDGHSGEHFINLLWHATAKTDLRIEPIHCGEREWFNGSDREIVEIARKEGLVLGAPKAA